MGGGAGDRVDPGDHVGEVLFHRAGRRAGDAREPDHGKARRALVPPAQGYPDDLLRRDGVLRRGREERGMTTRDSLGSRSTFKVGRRTFERSEEHTSELQSQSKLVCRLLLEKKKKKKKELAAYFYQHRID